MAEDADPAFVTQRTIIFITGASRSGTTLLSFVLRNHPAVFGLKELQYFGEIWDPRLAGQRFTKPEAVTAAAELLARQARGILDPRAGATERAAAEALVAALGPAACEPATLFAAVVHELARQAGKSIPCEQTPRNIFYAAALLGIYPQARVVHMVRDPRAVMASQKMRWQRRALAADNSSVSRYQSLRAWVNYHPFTVSRLWNAASRAALALESHPRVALLRFEDLVREPEPTVRRLCERLAIDYEPRMLDVGQINSSHQSAVGGARRGLHPAAIDKWRDVLSRSELAIAEQRCGALMQRFGYATSGVASLGTMANAGYHLSYLGHLGGVALVNPRRAFVQARALFRPRAPVTGTTAGAASAAPGPRTE